MWLESMLRNKHDAPQHLLCENITSSTKPEIHNVSHFCQSKVK